MNNIPRQLYFSLFPIYPTISLAVHGLRSEIFPTNWFSERTGYLLSDKDADLFEDELINYNQKLEMPLEKMPITISTTNKVASKVYGITMLSTGPNYVYPVRMLVNSVEEFRKYLPNIVEGATDLEFSQEKTKLLSDKEIQEVLLDESARRFLFQRSILQSANFFAFSTRYAIWIGCVAVGYLAFAVISRLASSTVAFLITAPIVTGLFLYVFQFVKMSQEADLDQKTYEIDDSYAEGCRSFLIACIKFGQLMNRLTKDEQPRPFTFTIEGISNKFSQLKHKFTRGEHPFTSEGNSTMRDQMPYTTRLELLDAYINEKKKQEKMKTLRQV